MGLKDNQASRLTGLKVDRGAMWEKSETREAERMWWELG